MNTAQAVSNPAAATAPYTGESPVDTQTLANISFYVFIAAAVAGVLQVGLPIKFGRGFEMVEVAKNLAIHGAFANPFAAANTGPTAAIPPGYPIVLAFIMKVLGGSAILSTIAVVINISMNAATAAMLPRVSATAFHDVMPGIVAAALWLVSVRLMPSWDVSCTVAGLVCLLLDVLLVRRTVLSGIRHGFLAGVLCLFNPSTLVITLSLFAHDLARRRKSFGTEKTYWFALFIASIVLPTAWLARNNKVLGAPVLRTNLGMTLYASNNDCAQPSLLADETDDCYQMHHPNTSPEEAALLQSMGEVRYDIYRVRATKEWVLGHKSRFIDLSLARVRQFWFPPVSENGAFAYVIALASILSVPGVVLVLIRREAISPFLGSSLLLYPAMYYIVVSDVRYRYPVLWISCLLAGYCAVIALRFCARTRLGQRYLPGSLRAFV